MFLVACSAFLWRAGITKYSKCMGSHHDASYSSDGLPVTILRLVTIQALVLLPIFNQSERSTTQVLSVRNGQCGISLLFSQTSNCGETTLFFCSTKMLMVTKPDAFPFEKEKLGAGLLFSPITM